MIKTDSLGSKSLGLPQAALVLKLFNQLRGTGLK
jgi:hypothetical protein